MKRSSRIASQKPPDREDLSDTFKSELEAMYAVRMDSVSEICVTFGHVVPTETVNANPDVVYVQIDAGGVQGRIVIDNLVSRDEHNYLIRWMTEGFDQNYASSYVSDTTSLLSGATTEGRQDVSRWDLTEVSYKEEGGQRNGTRWVPTFDENKTAVAQKVLRLTLQRFHNIMTLVFEGDDKVKPMTVHGDAPTPHGAPSRDAARYDLECGQNDGSDERLTHLQAELNESFNCNDEHSEEPTKFALQGTTYYFDNMSGMGQHFDSRARFGSIGTLTLHGEATLVQVRGAQRSEMTLRPRSFYVISGPARGDCLKHLAFSVQAERNHKGCKCCWTHGVTTANTHTFEQRGTPEAASARRLALTIRQLSPWVHHEWEKKDAELKQQAKLEEEANRPFPKPRKSSSAKGQPKGPAAGAGGPPQARAPGRPRASSSSASTPSALPVQAPAPPVKPPLPPEAMTRFLAQLKPDAWIELARGAGVVPNNDPAEGWHKVLSPRKTGESKGDVDVSYHYPGQTAAQDHLRSPNDVARYLEGAARATPLVPKPSPGDFLFLTKSQCSAMDEDALDQLVKAHPKPSKEVYPTLKEKVTAAAWDLHYFDEYLVTLRKWCDDKLVQTPGGSRTRGSKTALSSLSSLRLRFVDDHADLGDKVHRDLSTAEATVTPAVTAFFEAVIERISIDSYEEPMIIGWDIRRPSARQSMFVGVEASRSPDKAPWCARSATQDGHILGWRRSEEEAALAHDASVREAFPASDDLCVNFDGDGRLRRKALRLPGIFFDGAGWTLSMLDNESHCLARVGTYASQAEAAAVETRVTELLDDGWSLDDAVESVSQRRGSARVERPRVQEPLDLGQQRGRVEQPAPPVPQGCLSFKGKHFQLKADSEMRGVCVNAFANQRATWMELQTTDGDLVKVKANHVKKAKLTKAELARCNQPIDPKNWIQRRIDEAISVECASGQCGNLFVDARGNERRQFVALDANTVQCTLCEPSDHRAAYVWTQELAVQYDLDLPSDQTPLMNFLHSLKCHCGHRRSEHSLKAAAAHKAALESALSDTSARSVPILTVLNAPSRTRAPRRSHVDEASEANDDGEQSVVESETAQRAARLLARQSRAMEEESDDEAEGAPASVSASDLLRSRRHHFELRRVGTGPWHMFGTQYAALGAVTDLSSEALVVLLEKINTRYEARPGPDAHARRWHGEKPVEVRRVGHEEWQKFPSVGAAGSAYPDLNLGNVQMLLKGDVFNCNYEARYDLQPPARVTLQVRQRLEAGWGEWRGYPSQAAALAEYRDLTQNYLTGLLDEAVTKFEARYVERVQKPVLEVRKIGSDWVAFEGKNEAVRHFPELPAMPLYALLDVGSLFEAKRGGKLLIGVPKQVDVRQLGVADGSWCHFDSVKEASEAYVDHGKNFIRDILKGRIESTTHEARYTPASDDFVVKLRKKDDPNSDWVGFSSTAELYAKHPVLERHLSGLLHESASQFEARYIRDAQSHVADDEETRSVAAALVPLAPLDSGLQPHVEPPRGTAIEVRSLHDDDATWKWFKNRAAALSEFPDLRAETLNILLEGTNTWLKVQRGDGQSNVCFKPVEVKRVGDEEWQKFPSVSAARRAHPDVNHHHFDNLLRGRKVTCGYKIRYDKSPRPQAPVVVLRVRKRDESGEWGDWRDFSSRSDAVAEYDLSANDLAGLLHESVDQFEARYSKKEAPAPPPSLEVREVGSLDWLPFENISAALRKFPDLDRSALKALLHADAKKFTARRATDSRTAIMLKCEGHTYETYHPCRANAIAMHPELNADLIFGLLHPSHKQFEARYIGDSMDNSNDDSALEVEEPVAAPPSPEASRADEGMEDDLAPSSDGVSPDDHDSDYGGSEVKEQDDLASFSDGAAADDQMADDDDSESEEPASPPRATSPPHLGSPAVGSEDLQVQYASAGETLQPGHAVCCVNDASRRGVVSSTTRMLIFVRFSQGEAGMPRRELRHLSADAALSAEELAALATPSDEVRNLQCEIDMHVRVVIADGGFLSNDYVDKHGTQCSQFEAYKLTGDCVGVRCHVCDLEQVLPASVLRDATRGKILHCLKQHCGLYSNSPSGYAHVAALQDRVTETVRCGPPGAASGRASGSPPSSTEPRADAPTDEAPSPLREDDRKRERDATDEGVVESPPTEPRAAAPADEAPAAKRTRTPSTRKLESLAQEQPDVVDGSTVPDEVRRAIIETTDDYNVREAGTPLYSGSPASSPAPSPEFAPADRWPDVGESCEFLVDGNWYDGVCRAKSDEKVELKYKRVHRGYVHDIFTAGEAPANLLRLPVTAAKRKYVSVDGAEDARLLKRPASCEGVMHVDDGEMPSAILETFEDEDSVDDDPPLECSPSLRRTTRVQKPVLSPTQWNDIFSEKSDT